MTADGPAEVSFNRPFIAGNELRYIEEAVRQGQLAGNGTFTRRCQAWLEQTHGARKVLLTHSCTAALEMAALLADLGPGDEVILPSFTFVSTANAIVLRGATPLFVDIRPDTLNLDESLIPAAITARTRAIVPVHYAGVACEMDTIMEIADQHRLLVLEDAAQGVMATYKGRHLGTLGQLGCYSFHETKNLICGEGGALAINEERFLERAEIIWEKGTNRSQFQRGDAEFYDWRDVGSSFLPSELTAAFLCAQLEEAEAILERRRGIYARYLEGLGELEERELLRLPVVPPECGHNAHLFYVLLRDREQRDGLLRHLRARGIHALFHYVPLHSSPMGRKLGGAKELPVTEEMSGRLARLPCFHELTSAQQDGVIEAIGEFLR